MNYSQPETMKRGEFLRSLGMSSAALMSVYCLGTLSACSSDDDDPAPGGNTTNPPPTGFTGNADPARGPIDFTLDLNSATYSKLKTAGEFVSAGAVVIANAGGNYVAIGRICTHQAGNLNFRAANNDFQCDNHGGLFNLDGSVKGPPPTRAVTAYKAQLTGNNLRVTA